MPTEAAEQRPTVSVDDQDQVEQTLRDKQRELALLVDMVPSHLWRLTSEGEPVFFNKPMVDFLGLDVKDMDKPGMTRLAAMIDGAIHPNDAVAFGNTLRRCLTTGDPFFMRYRLRRSDGAYRWMSSRSEPLRDEAGRIVQWYGLCHDIDEQVQAEDALRQREELLHQMIDALPVRVWSVAGAGGPVYFNKRHQDYLHSVLPGFEALGEAGIERLLEELVHPEDVCEVKRTLRNCFETGGPCRMRFRWREKLDAYRWAECRVEPRRDRDGVIVQWWGVSLDIDDEMRAKEAERDRQLELAQVIDMVPVYIARMAPNGDPTFFNKRTVDLVGVDVDAFDRPGISRLAAAMAATIHPDDVGPMSEKLGRSLVTGEPYSIKYRNRCPDGGYRWMHGRAEPLRDRNGTIVHWYAATVDIDDEVRAQDALRERERELSHLVDMVPSHVWRLTPEGRPNFYNKRLSEYLGLSTASAESPNISWLDAAIESAIHADDAAGVREALDLSFANGERFAMKYRLRRADGVYRWMSGRAEPLRDEAGRILEWYGLAHDIDDQVHAEEALRRASEKLAQATRATSLAELSASIAHEVNQPLAAIVANSQACQRWLSMEPPGIERAKKTVERITRDAISAADVVSRIRALFREAPHVRSSEDVNALIREVCRLLADVVSAKSISIKTNLEPGLPPITLDRVQVLQVLMNLLRNGIEAMDGAVDGARVIQIRSCCDEFAAIRVEVRDSGTGIHDAERVFEPFFTTKPQGMGMGLAICRSIVESHGGRIWMANDEVRGALVVFTLPLSVSPSVGGPTA